MTIPRASRVAFAVAFVAASGPVAGIGVTGAVAQGVPELHTAATPLFHSSASSDDRVSLIGRLSRALLLSPDRLVFVDLSLNWLVFVNTSDGSVVTAGRKGEGPREFRLPILMGRSADGTVVVWDALHRRVEFVNADGTFAEAPEFDGPVFASMTIQASAGYSDGTVVITDDGFPIGIPGQLRREPGVFRQTVTFQAAVPNRTPSLIAQFSGPEYYLERQGSRSSMRPVIFGHELHYTQVGQHLAVAQTDLGAAHILDLSGAMVAEVPLPPPIVMSDEQISVVRKRIEDMAKDGAGRRSQTGVPASLPRPAEPFLFRNLPANNVAPGINHMLGDLDGRLWLRIFRPGEEAEHWQVWEIDGPNLKFTLTLREGEELLDAAGDRVLVRTRDEFDAEYLVLRRIEG